MIGSTKAINAPKAGNAAPEVESDGFGRAILRHKWMIFTSVLIGLTAATWLAARQVPLYASHSTVLFEQYVKAGSADAVVSDPFLNAQTDLMLSPAVLDAAATQLLHAHLKTLADSTNISGTLQQTIKARVRKEDGTITLSYVCLVASDSATIINTVVDSYRDYEIKHRQTTATDAFGELQQAKLHADAEMNSILGKIQEFKSRNPDFSMDDRIASNLATAKLAKLNQDLTDAQANLLEVQAKYDSLAAQLGPQETAGKNASADDADVDLAGVQSELDKASANLDSLTSKGLPPTDSSVQDARAYLARVRQKLSVCQRNASYADLTKLKAEVDLAQRRQSEMQTAFDQQKHAVAALNIKSAEFSALQDQQQNLQRSSDDLDSKIHQINLAMDIPLDIRVLEKAQPAIAPIDVRSRYMGIGGLSGLLLGFGLSLGLYLTDGRLRTPLEVGNAMGLPVLGVIPHQTKSLSIADIGFKSHTDPMSDVAEAARSVRTALFSAARSTPIKTVLVTSPTHGEGKTAFAVNLAIAMAQAGSRTLLVDASFGEPILQKMFEIRKITGLSNVLAGYITYEKTISRTPVERLEVMPGGQMPRNSSDLLNGPVFADLMEKLASRYQCIILDGSPVLERNDARILGATADITLCVVRAGCTTAKSADQGLEQLLSVGSRVLGTVVNDVQPRHANPRARGSVAGVESIPHDQPLSDRAVRTQGAPAERKRAISGLAVKKSDSTVMPEVDIMD